MRVDVVESCQLLNGKNIVGDAEDAGKRMIASDGAL